MSSEFDESQWFDLQVDSDSELDDIHQEQQGSSLSRTFQNANTHLSSNQVPVTGSESHLTNHRQSYACTTQNTSTTYSSNASQLSEQTLPLTSHQHTTDFICNHNNYSLKPNIQTPVSHSGRNSSLSQCSLHTAGHTSSVSHTPSTNNSSNLCRHSTISTESLLSQHTNNTQNILQNTSRNISNSLSQYSLPLSTHSTRTENLPTMNIINGEQNSLMDDTSMQFHTLLADSSQDSSSQLSNGLHGYSADHASKGLSLSEHPLENLSGSPTSDHAASEDNSECQEVVHSAISEVSKDFLTGNFSRSDLPVLESDSTQVSSDDDVKLAERSIHGKYPETAAGMSDSDWNPYVTESDSNASPRVDVASSNVKVTPKFSPLLSSMDLGASTLMSVTSSATNGSNIDRYKYTNGHNLTRSDQNLRSFLGRNVEKNHLESLQQQCLTSEAVMMQRGEAVSKDYAIGAQHAATYLTKSHVTDNEETPSDVNSNSAEIQLDSIKKESVLDSAGVVSPNYSNSNANLVKEMSGQSREGYSMFSDSDYRNTYSNCQTDQTSEYLSPNRTLTSGENKIVDDNNVLKRQAEDNLERKETYREHHNDFTEPKPTDASLGYALSQTYKSNNSTSTYSTTSREVQHMLDKENSKVNQVQLNTNGEGILKTRVDDILTKTSYLEADSEAEFMGTGQYGTGSLPSSIDYRQLHQDLQEIQKSLHNFSDQGDSESGSECSLKLGSRDASFTLPGSCKEGTIIPSPTTTPDRIPKQHFRDDREQEQALRISQGDDTDQSDDIRKYEQSGQNGKKSSLYNSEGEETQGSSSSTKGESDSGQRTPTLTSQQSLGVTHDVDEFLQNVRYQRGLILSQNCNSVVSGMADQISHILHQENPSTQAHGILQEVDAQEQELTKHISFRRSADFSFTDTSTNNSQGSLIITDEDIRKKLHLSGLSSLDTTSCSEGFSDLSMYDRPGSPFSAFKEARRFMSKQMEMVAERSFNHSIELRTPYRSVLSTYPVYGFKKDSDAGSRRGRKYEHFGVREAWQRLHSDRSSEENTDRNPEGTSSLPGEKSKLQQTVDEKQSAASLPEREYREVEKEISLPVSGDHVDTELNYSFSERRMASSPAGETIHTEEKAPAASSLPLTHIEQQNEPPQVCDTSGPSSYAVISPIDSDGSSGRRRDRFRPYRPAGSRDLYYTESDTADSVTTMESTHTGSDDAVPPNFPSHILGSRKDPQILSAGIYGTKTQAETHTASGIALSTIEERSIVDERERILTTVGSSRSMNENASALNSKSQNVIDTRGSQKGVDVSDSRGQERTNVGSSYSDSRLLSMQGSNLETYNRKDSGSQYDTQRDAHTEFRLENKSPAQTQSKENSGEKREIKEQEISTKNVDKRQDAVTVRDSATSPIIAYSTECVKETSSAAVQTTSLTFPSKSVSKTSSMENESFGSFDLKTTYTDARAYRSLLDDTQVDQENGKIAESRRQSSGPHSTKALSDSSLFEADVPRNTASESPSHPSVVFSTASPHPTHTAVPTSTAMNSFQQVSSQNYLLEETDRQSVMEKEEHTKPELTQNRRPRTGRSELRDRIAQERNSRLPNNSTSEEEVEQNIDKTPMSRKAQLLRQTLEQEIDLTIAPNINTMWQRFQELNSTETDSTMNTSRMETLVQLVRNPTKHTIQMHLDQKEQGRKENEEKFAERREQQRKEVKNYDSQKSEVKNSKLHTSQDSDFLYSIPEDSFGTPSKRKSPNRKQEVTMDPHMKKLREKIQRQKDKIDKERKKELRRMEKLMKLQQLLKAKRKGQISNHVLSQSIDEISSTSIPTESSTEVTSNESTITASSSMSDTPTEETTAKDSSVELQLAKLAKDEDFTFEDTTLIDNLYKEAVRKHFHSKDKNRSEHYKLSDQLNQNNQKIMEDDLTSFKENIKSLEDLFHTRSRGDQRQKPKRISSRSGKKCVSGSVLKGQNVGYFSSRKERKTRDVGTIVPTPKRADFRSRDRRTRNEDESRYSTFDDNTPVISIPVVKMTNRSSSPGFSTRYTPEEQTNTSMTQRRNKHVSKGIAWFVDLKDDQPWKKKSLTKDKKWRPTEKEEFTWRSPLKERQERVREVVDTRPVVKHYEELSQKEPVKEIFTETTDTKTLQEVFAERMAWFISRSRERQKRMELAARERRMQELFHLEHEKLFGDQKRNLHFNVDVHPLSDKHYKPEKRILTRSEQKELTEKIYKQLPEVVNRKKQRRVEYQKQLNRLKARLFNKKIQKQVLRKAGILA